MTTQLLNSSSDGNTNQIYILQNGNMQTGSQLDPSMIDAIIDSLNKLKSNNTNLGANIYQNIGVNYFGQIPHGATPPPPLTPPPAQIHLVPFHKIFGHNAGPWIVGSGLGMIWTIIWI